MRFNFSSNLIGFRRHHEITLAWFLMQCTSHDTLCMYNGVAVRYTQYICKGVLVLGKIFDFFFFFFCTTHTTEYLSIFVLVEYKRFEHFRQNNCVLVIVEDCHFVQLYLKYEHFMIFNPRKNGTVFHKISFIIAPTLSAVLHTIFFFFLRHNV